MNKIILASGSPRRTVLLDQLGLEHEVFIPNILEENLNNLSPQEYVMEMAYKKAIHTKNTLMENHITIISADTVVAYKGHILEKPISEKDAFQMLKKLSGKNHYVFTGLTVINIGYNYYEETICDSSMVTMRNYTDEEIDFYISTKEPFDKAGSYGIQGVGAILVDKIEGDFNTIVGLPLVRLYNILSEIDNNRFRQKQR